MAAGRRREDAAQVAEDLRGIAEGIRWKQNGVERAGLEPVAQHVGTDGPVQRHQSTDAGEGEAQAHGNRREAFGGQENHEREALAAVGQLGGEEP